MPPNHDHGVGTGVGDEVFQTKGKALSAAAALIKERFEQGKYLGLKKSADGRTVTHYGFDVNGNPIAVSIRVDEDHPSTIIPELVGSFDISSEMKTGRGRNLRVKTHFGYAKK